MHDARRAESQRAFDPYLSLASSLENSRQSQFLARDDFAQFCTLAVYDDISGLPIVLAPFQVDIIDAIIGPYRFVIIIVPRNHGKSSLLSAYISFLLGRNPNLRIIVASNTENQAAGILRKAEFILRSIEFQNIFSNLIPPAKAAKWTDTEKIVNRTRPMKDPSLLAMGVGSSIAVGKRSDLVILDDIVDEDYATSPTLMRKVSTWFWKEVYPTLEPRSGKVIVLGTRWSIRDFYQELMDKLRPSPDQAKIIQLQAIKPDGMPLWPERFPMEELDFIRRSQGSIFFSAAFMNDPIDLASAFLRPDWLHYTDSLPSELLNYIGIDPNISTTREADYFVLAVIGHDPVSGHSYLRHILRLKANLREQAQAIKDEILRWQPAAVGIESDAAQALLGDYFAEAVGYPIQKISSRSVPKVVRIAGMAKYFEQGRVLLHGEYNLEEALWLPVHSLEPFVEEWGLFSDPPRVGTHDDCLDAVQRALSLIPEGESLYSLVEPSPQPTASTEPQGPSSTAPDLFAVSSFFGDRTRRDRILATQPGGSPGGFFRHFR